MVSVMVLAVAGYLMVSVGSAQATVYTDSYQWSGAVNFAKGAWQLNSSNGVYKAVYQSDGNFVVYHGSKATWASSTCNKQPPADYLALQSDGKLQILSMPVANTPSRGVLWQNSMKASSSVRRLSMQNDGNLVEYTGTATVIWATGTNGK